jgi:hypothetical protein
MRWAFPPDVSPSVVWPGVVAARRSWESKGAIWRGEEGHQPPTAARRDFGPSLPPSFRGWTWPGCTWLGMASKGPVRHRCDSSTEGRKSFPAALTRSRQGKALYGVPWPAKDRCGGVVHGKAWHGNEWKVQTISLCTFHSTNHKIAA